MRSIILRESLSYTQVIIYRKQWISKELTTVSNACMYMSPLKLSILLKLCMGMFKVKNSENFQKESKIDENDLPVGLDSLITVIMGDVSVPPLLLAVQRYLPSFCTVNE